MCNLDFPHAPAWCDACWEQEQRGKEINLQRDTLAELKRANDLKEWELEWGGSPRPKREYIPPNPQPEPRPKIERRGM
jgi:hypothetical protein